MIEGSFLGISTSAWLAIAAFVYAAATAAIAWVANWTSNKAIAAASKATSQQIAAAREAAVIQARASSVSNNRQQWINSLRDEVTGFLTDAELGALVRDKMPMNEERAREQRRIIRALTAHIFKVRLLLNPTEGESKELVEMLIAVSLSGGLSDEDRERIVSHTQGILKTEWERVKSGE